MKVLELGHAYALAHLDSTPRTLRGLFRALYRWWHGVEVLEFRKRSSKMVTYEVQHEGTNTQELLRVIIELCDVAEDRSRFLDNVQECNETGDAIAFIGEAVGSIRLALYSYEVRAYRRKQANLNKQAGKHDDTEEPTGHGWRDGFEDIPFTSHEIEYLDVGPDGHIIWPPPEQEAQPEQQAQVRPYTAADVEESIRDWRGPQVLPPGFFKAGKRYKTHQYAPFCALAGCEVCQAIHDERSGQ